MEVNKMTKEDFDNVPYYKDISFDYAKPFNSIVIIPTGEMHDSGYQIMDFVAVSNETFEPICKLSGVSDVIEIDGIGGFGPLSITRCKKIDDEFVIPVKGWCIDCLPCGYLRLFAREGLYLQHHDYPLSSFEIYAK